MKRFLLFSLLFGFLLFGVNSVSAAPTTLYQYYQGNLPSIDERSEIAASVGIWGYRGTAEQNTELLRRLITPPPSFLDDVPHEDEELLGVSVVTRYRTTLQSPMTSSQTTVPVSTVVTFDGTTLTTDLIDGVVYLTLEPGSSREEIVKCIAVTSGQFTGCTRGLAFSGTSETSVAANRKSHNAGSTVVMSNVHYIFNNLVDTDTSNSQSVTGDFTFTTGTIYLGDGTTADNKNVFANNGDLTLPFVRYNESLNRWQFSDDGLNSVNFTSSSASGLSASTTSGIGITDSFIFAKPSTTVGYAFDTDGNFYRAVSTTGGIDANSQGLYVDKTDDFAWTGEHTFNGSALTTTPSANNIPIASTTAELAPGWIGGSSVGDIIVVTSTDQLGALPIGTNGQIIKSNGSLPLWVDDEKRGVGFSSSTSRFSYMLSTLSDGWSNTNATLSQNKAWLLVTTAGGGGTGYVQSPLPSLWGTGTDNLQWDDGLDIDFEFLFKVDADNNNNYIGISDTGCNDASGDFIGFFIDGEPGPSQKLTARMVQESVATASTTISGITPTNWNAGRIEYENGSEVRYYVNGELAVTYNSGFPTDSESVYFCAGGSASGADIEFTQVYISQEF